MDHDGRTSPGREAGGWDLARLVAPTTPEVFLAECWDQRPLVCARKDPEYFASLFRLEEVEPLLRGYGIVASPDAMRLVKRGATPPVIPIVGAPPDLALVHRAFDEGYSLNVDDLATHHVGLRRLVHALASRLGLCPRPNLCFTPPWSRAFDLHFDTHDVLIVQLAGAKEWRVYPRIETNPTDASSDGSFVAREAVGAPVLDVVLEAGDTLYLPRGFVREAHTDEQLSLDLTFEMVMGTYRQLLEHMLALAETKSPALRASIPPGALFARANASSRATAAAEILRLVARELSSDLVGDALDRWAARELAVTHALDVPRTFGPEPPLELHTPLRKPENLVPIVTVSRGRARIHFQRGMVEGPFKIRPALEYVVAEDVVTARGFGGRLSDEERLVLARRLVGAGVLVRAG